MNVPRGYEKLGWRLNSARRSDPHRFLTSQDVDAAFQEAQWARDTGKQKKRVVIEIVNTVCLKCMYNLIQDSISFAATVRIQVLQAVSHCRASQTGTFDDAVYPKAGSSQGGGTLY
jgi:hypothetical protein